MCNKPIPSSVSYRLFLLLEGGVGHKRTRDNLFIALARISGSEQPPKDRARARERGISFRSIMNDQSHRQNQPIAVPSNTAAPSWEQTSSLVMPGSSYARFRAVDPTTTATTMLGTTGGIHPHQVPALFESPLNHGEKEQQLDPSQITTTTSTASSSFSLSSSLPSRTNGVQRHNSNDDVKLQVATQYCTRGRQLWMEGGNNYDDALDDFQRALLILETVLGTSHPLVAQLYHWMGLIHQERHDYDRAVQSLIQCLRIRYFIAGGRQHQHQHQNRTFQDSTTMEVQAALSNLWQATGEASTRSFELIRNLQEAVQLEIEGDSVLEGEHDNNGSNKTDKILLAMKLYQKSMTVFPDLQHSSIMSKLALCYHKAHSMTTDDTSHSHNNNYLDQAIIWYRMSLKVFCTSIRFPPSKSVESNSNSTVIESHTDYQWIIQQVQLAMKDYYIMDVKTIQHYSRSIRKSVIHQHCAEDLARQCHLQQQDKSTTTKHHLVNDSKENSSESIIDRLATARRHYRSALALEQPMWGNYHLVVMNLQKEIAALDQQYIQELEIENATVKERLHLLEDNSSDWIQTVRYQEEQLRVAQNNASQKDTLTREAVAAIASKDAEIVGWKRKYDVAQKEWKTAERNFQDADDQNKLLQQQLTVKEAKVAQLEYLLKKQDIDHAKSEDANRSKWAEGQEWKDKHEAIVQANQNLTSQIQRLSAMERDLQDRLAETQQQNIVLKELNREIQTEVAQLKQSITTSKGDGIDQQRIAELEVKLKESVASKERAIKKYNQAAKELKNKSQNRSEGTTGDNKKVEVLHSEADEMDSPCHADSPEAVIALQDKVRQLERHIEILEEDKVALKRAVEESGGGKKSSKRSKQNLEDSQTLQDVQHRAERLATQLTDTEWFLEKAQKEHKDAMLQIRQLEQCNREMESGIADASDTIKMLNTANGELIEQYSKLLTEKQNLHEQLDEFAQKSGKRVIVHTDDSDDDDDDNNGDDGMQAMLIDQVAELEVQNEALHGKLEKSRGANKKLVEAVKSLKSQVENLEHQNREIIVQLQQASTTASETEIEDMREKLDNSKGEKKKLKETIKSMQSKIEDLEQQNKEIIVQLEQASKSISETKFEDMRAKLEKSKGDNKKLVEAFKLMKSKVEDLEQQNKECVMQSEQAERTTSTSRALESPSSNEGNDTKIAELSDELKEAVKENEGLRSEVRALKKQIEFFRGGIALESDHLVDRISDLELEVQRAVSERDIMKSDKGRPESPMPGIEEQKRLTARCSELELELNEAVEQIDILSNQLRQYKKQTEGNDERQQHFQERCAKLEKELEHAVNESRGLSAQVQTCKNELESARNRNTRTPHLESELDACRKLNEQLVSQLDEYKSRVEVLAKHESESGSDPKKKCEDLEQELQRLEKINEMLVAQLKELKSQAEDSSNDKRLQSRLVTRCSELESELEDCVKQKEILISENKFYKNQMDEAEEEKLEHQSLVGRYKELESELQQEKEKNVALTVQAEESGQSLENLSEKDQEEKQNLTNRCAELEKELQESVDESKRLSSDVTDLTSQLQETKEQFQIIMMQAEQHSKSRSTPMDNKKENQRLAARVHDLEKELKESTDKNKSMTLQIATMLESLDALGGVKTENERLTQLCSEMENELKIISERNDKRMSAPEEEQKEQQELIHKFKELERELNECTDRNEKLLSQLDGYRNRVKSTENGATDDSYHLDRCVELGTELSVAMKENQILLTQVESLKREITDLETYADETASDLEKAGLVIAQLKAGGTGGAVGSTPGDLAELQRKNAELQQELDSALEDLVHLQHQSPLSAVTSTDDEEGIAERVKALTAAKDELQRLLDESLKDNLHQIDEVDRLQEQLDEAEKDRKEIDRLYQLARKEMAQLKSDLVETKEHLKDAQMESEELGRQLEIEKHVADARKSAANADPDEENELEGLYRQAREELKELEAMLFEAEDQLEVLKSKNAKLEDKAGNVVSSKEDFHDQDLSSDTVHSLDDLSREELITENKRTLRKLSESRTRVIDLQENVLILQTQLKDALNFQEKQNSKQQPMKSFWGRKLAVS